MPGRKRGLLLPMLLVPLAGCAGPERAAPTSTGTLTVTVELEGAADVDRLHYRARGNGLGPVVGSVAVGPEAAVATFAVTGLAPGPGYVVDLSAESAEGDVVCRGGFAVDLTPAERSAARLVLLCRPVEEDAVPLDGPATCPALASYGASSFSAAVGKRIQLHATAEEGAGDNLRFRWSADRGRLLESDRPRATFVCETPGRYTVTAAVDNGWCTSGVFFTITCVDEAAGPLAGR